MVLTGRSQEDLLSTSVKSRKCTFVKYYDQFLVLTNTYISFILIVSIRCTVNLSSYQWEANLHVPRFCCPLGSLHVKSAALLYPLWFYLSPSDHLYLIWMMSSFKLYFYCCQTICVCLCCVLVWILNASGWEDGAKGRQYKGKHAAGEQQENPLECIIWDCSRFHPTALHSVVIWCLYTVHYPQCCLLAQKTTTSSHHLYAVCVRVCVHIATLKSASNPFLLTIHSCLHDQQKAKVNTQRMKLNFAHGRTIPHEFVEKRPEFQCRMLKTKHYQQDVKRQTFSCYITAC